MPWSNINLKRFYLSSGVCVPGLIPSFAFMGRISINDSIRDGYAHVPNITNDDIVIGMEYAKIYSMDKHVTYAFSYIAYMNSDTFEKYK
jgi:hypothetical protein